MGVVAHPSYPSTSETEAGGSLGYREFKASPDCTGKPVSRRGEEKGLGSECGLGRPDSLPGEGGAPASLDLDLPHLKVA